MEHVWRTLTLLWFIMAYYGLWLLWFIVHYANLKETWKMFGPQAGTMGCLVNLVKIGECFTRL
jgi:hypothetical protein